MGFITQHVRGSYAELLREINTSPYAMSYSSAYSKHDEWLDRAIQDIKDVKSGRRHCFGVFCDEDYSKLVCSVILKRDDHRAGVIEIKNLIPAAHIAEAEYPKLLKMLLIRAREFAQYRGFHRLITEIPVDFLEAVALFISDGFIVEAAREHPGLRRSKFYHLSQELPRTYVGDAFDTISYMNWVLSEVGQNFVPKIEFGIQYLEFSLPLYKSTATQLEVPSACGRCFIFEQHQSEEQLKKALLHHVRESQLNIIVADELSIPTRLFCDRRRAKVISFAELGGIRGNGGLVGAVSHLHEASDIGGIVIEALPYIQEQIKECESGFVYILANAHGAFLNEDDVVLFVSSVMDPTMSKVDLQVGAIARVARSTSCTIEHAREEMKRFYGGAGSDLAPVKLWSEYEFNLFFDSFHSNQEILNRVGLLILDEVHFFPVPVSADQLLDEADIGSCKSLFASHYVEDCYISKASAVNIRKVQSSTLFGCRPATKSFGGRFFQALVEATAIIAEDGDRRILALLEELRLEFYRGGKDSVSNGSPEVLEAIRYGEGTIVELGQPLEEFFMLLRNPRFTAADREEKKSVLAARIVSILEGGLVLPGLSHQTRQLFQEIKALFSATASISTRR